MKCQQFTLNLDDFLDQYIAADEASLLQAHMESCSDCQTLYQQQLALRALLKALPVPEPTAGFADRALSQAMIEGRQRQADVLNDHDQSRKPDHVVHHRAGFIKGFSSALAAGLALWLVVGVLPVKQETAHTVDQGIKITVQQVHTVKLAFQSVSALQNARITIRLPDNVEIVGYEGKSELAWNTDLKQGDNILKLPIKANSLMNGRIVAEIEHNNQVKTIGIDLQVKKPGLTMEPLGLKIV
jgi:hypothetical protein